MDLPTQPKSSACTTLTQLFILWQIPNSISLPGIIFVGLYVNKLRRIPFALIVSESALSTSICREVKPDANGISDDVYVSETMP